MIQKACLFALAFMSMAQAATFGVDWNNAFRTYPIGASTELQPHITIPLWGTFPLQGGIKTFGSVKTSGQVSSFAGGLAFYPVSFIKLEIRSIKNIRSLEELDQFNCEREDCDSNSTQLRFGGELGIKAGPFFARLTHHLKRVKFADQNKEVFAEETTTLLSQRIDTSSHSGLFMGFEMNPNEKWGVFANYYTMQKQTNHNANMGFFHQMPLWTGKFTIGAGAFHGRFGHNHPMLFTAFSRHFGTSIFPF